MIDSVDDLSVSVGLACPAVDTRCWTQCSHVTTAARPSVKIGEVKSGVRHQRAGNPPTRHSTLFSRSLPL